MILLRCDACQILPRFLRSKKVNYGTIHEIHMTFRFILSLLAPLNEKKICYNTF